MFKSALLKDEPMAYGVRHGTTEANVNDEFRGWEDFELEEQGINEAHEAAEWFVTHGVKPTRIISSPLSRALATAKIIGTALGVEVEVEERFKPLNVGEYTGEDKDKTWDEFVRYLDNPDKVIPGGENVNGFADRDCEALEEYLVEAATNGPIIFVWHTSNTVVADGYLKEGLESMNIRPEEKDIVAPGGIVAISPTRQITPVFKDVKKKEEKEDPEKAEHEEYDTKKASHPATLHSFDGAFGNPVTAEGLEKKFTADGGLTAKPDYSSRAEIAKAGLQEYK
jgi:broad specificity phosphatase PhoE